MLAKESRAPTSDSPISSGIPPLLQMKIRDGRDDGKVPELEPVAQAETEACERPPCQEPGQRMIRAEYGTSDDQQGSHGDAQEADREQHVLAGAGEKVLLKEICSMSFRVRWCGPISRTDPLTTGFLLRRHPR